MKRQRRPSLVNTQVPDEDIARRSIDTFFQTEFLVLQLRALYVLLGARAARVLLGLWQGESLQCQVAATLPQVFVVLAVTFIEGSWSYFDYLACGLALAECVAALVCLDEPLLPCILAIMLYPAIFRIRVQHIIGVSILATLLVQVLSSWGRRMDLLHRVYWLLAIAFTWWMSAFEKNLVLQLCKERIRLEREERRSGSLLARMLPASTSHRLKEGEHQIASRHHSVTILFAKILHVTEYAQKMPAERLLSLLNDVYFRFDQLMDQFRVYKIETVGEVYVCSSGLPLACTDHAARCARVAFAMVEAIKEFRGPDGKPLELQVGMHSGEIVSGVIGVLLPRYRLFGDTINTASRMCTNAPGPGQVTCSLDTRTLLGQGMEVRGLEPQFIKGKGMMELFVVEDAAETGLGATGSAESDPTAEALREDVTDTIGYEVEMEVRGGAVGGKGSVLVFVAFQAIVLVRSTDEYGNNTLNRSFGSLTPGRDTAGEVDTERMASGGRIKMNSWSNRTPSATSDTSSPRSLADSPFPTPPIRERRRSIMQAFIPPVDKLKLALQQMPMRLSDEKYGIPMDQVAQITHSMDRSRVELTLVPTENSSEPLQVDLKFEGSWLKHEFITTLTEAIGSDVIVDDLLVPATMRRHIGKGKRIGPGLQALANIVCKAEQRTQGQRPPGIRIPASPSGRGTESPPGGLVRAVSVPLSNSSGAVYSGQGLIGTGVVRMTDEEVLALQDQHPTVTSPSGHEHPPQEGQPVRRRRRSTEDRLGGSAWEGHGTMLEGEAAQQHRTPEAGREDLFKSKQVAGDDLSRGNGSPPPLASPRTADMLGSPIPRGALRNRGVRGGGGGGGGEGLGGELRQPRHVNFGVQMGGGAAREEGSSNAGGGKAGVELPAVAAAGGGRRQLQEPCAAEEGLQARAEGAWRWLGTQWEAAWELCCQWSWVSVQAWNPIQPGWDALPQRAARYGGVRRGSLPVVQPLSRSMTWRMGMLQSWQSTFSLCKDEQHAEAWKEMIEVLRQKQQRGDLLYFEHPVLEGFFQDQLGMRYYALLSFKLLIFVPLFLVDVTHDLAHAGAHHSALGASLRERWMPARPAEAGSGGWGWGEAAHLSMEWLVELAPVAAAFALGVAVSRQIQGGCSVLWKAKFWSALVVLHAGYVLSRGAVLGGALPAWKEPEEVQEAVTCLLIATMVNDAGWPRTLATVAVIVAMVVVRAVALCVGGSGDAGAALSGLLTTLKTALAVLVVVFQSESVAREHFRKTALVQHEISMSRTVLRNLLPRSGGGERVREGLTAMDGRHIIKLLVQTADEVSVPPPCDKFHSVTILFADIVSFTAMSSKLTPQQLVDMLNEIFSHFDRLAMKNKVYKVETIGDCYFCATGMPEPDEDHADNMLRMAIDMQAAAEHFMSPTGDQVRFRIGMASGPVVAGVVGHRMPRYHLFGSTIKKAESMEQGGEAGRVLVSTATYSLFSQQGRDLLQSCGRVEDDFGGVEEI